MTIRVKNRKKIVDYINQNDIFYIRDLRNIFLVTKTEEDKTIDEIIGTILKKLKKFNFIQCCNVEKGERQYIKIKNIPKEFIKDTTIIGDLRIKIKIK